jgi:hypothetical protein
MATHRISILGPNTLPDSSGNVFPECYAIKATNRFWKHAHFIFLDTATKDSLYTLFHVPKNYVGAAKFILVWTSTVTTGSVVWEVAYRTVAGDDTTSLDQAAAEETLNVTDAAPGATDRRLQCAVTAAAANFAADETVEVKVSRDGTQGSDTLAGAAQLVDVIFEYADA